MGFLDPLPFSPFFYSLLDTGHLHFLLRFGSTLLKNDPHVMSYCIPLLCCTNRKSSDRVSQSGNISNGFTSYTSPAEINNQLIELEFHEDFPGHPVNRTGPDSFTEDPFDRRKDSFDSPSFTVFSFIRPGSITQFLFFPGAFSAIG